MRIIFAGTPDFAAHTLSALINAGDYEICAVYTQPDRPAGRGRKLTASPVKQIALDHNIQVEQPLNFKQQSDVDQLASYQAELMIVVAYGLLLPQAVLDTPKYGCINIHASLLPKWRGAAPIQRAILAGDTQSGVCIMQMEAGLDTGPVLSHATCPIHDRDTSQQLHDRLATLGAKTLLESLPKLSSLQSAAQEQNHSQTTYADKITKAEATIDWQQPAHTVLRQVKAFNPWPIAQTTWQQHTLRIWDALAQEVEHTSTAGTILKVDKQGIDIACGQGILTLTQLQLPGKRALAVQDFVNANDLEPGQHLG